MAQDNRQLLKLLKNYIFQHNTEAAMPVNLGPPPSSTICISGTAQICPVCGGVGYHGTAVCPSCHGYGSKHLKEWIPTGRRPIGQKNLPPEGKVCLVWLEGEHLPHCGYIHHENGDKNRPLWITYGMASSTAMKASQPGDRLLSLGDEPEDEKEEVRNVTYFCDCLPPNAPPGFDGGVYEEHANPKH